MRKIVEIMLEDLSSREVFLFRVRCQACDTEYANKPIGFSKAGLIPETAERELLYNAIYEQEYTNARQSAIRNGAEHFNCCPVCKRVVCNRCFWICDELDMCITCAERLKEKGSPVASELLEFVI